MNTENLQRTRIIDEIIRENYMEQLIELKLPFFVWLFKSRNSIHFQMLFLVFNAFQCKR